MSALLVGDARCSTDAQDPTAQRDGLVALGVTAERVYVDYADTRVMPTLAGVPLPGKRIGLSKSAYRYGVTTAFPDGEVA